MTTAATSMSGCRAGRLPPWRAECSVSPLPSKWPARANVEIVVDNAVAVTGRTALASRHDLGHATDGWIDGRHRVLLLRASRPAGCRAVPSDRLAGSLRLPDPPPLPALSAAPGARGSLAAEELLLRGARWKPGRFPLRPGWFSGERPLTGAVGHSLRAAHRCNRRARALCAGPPNGTRKPGRYDWGRIATARQGLSIASDHPTAEDLTRAAGWPAPPRFLRCNRRAQRGRALTLCCAVRCTWRDGLSSPGKFPFPEGSREAAPFFGGMRGGMAVAPPEGFEPPTPALGRRRSIH